jgi:hypothetical protein
VLLVIASAIRVAYAAVPDWAQQSDRNAQLLLQLLAKYNPETTGKLGVDGLDDKIIDLKPELYERSREDFRRAVDELKQRRDATSDGLVRQDLEILIKAGENNIRSAEVQRQHMLPYYNVPQLVFIGMRTLLDPQIAKQRQRAALIRLKLYAGVAEDAKPLTLLAAARTTERLDDHNLIGPYLSEVEQNLADGQRYADGIKELLQKSGLQDWQPAYAQLAQQFKDYNDWVRATVLPRARKESRLPEPVYADNLTKAGVDLSPQALMAQAQFSFSEIQHQMQALAPLVAKQKALKSSDYRAVIRELKKKQLLGAAIMPLYQRRLAQIEDIIRREGIVTLPQRKAAIRLATAAESAQQPAPNMSPPRLIGNTGEHGEFLLPLNVPSADGSTVLRTDDFTFDAASWTLTAHEARPGHELQFATMAERGVSVARAVFAFNSANVEGWGLYAEAEMQPYEPVDGQLITLQFRLLRAARAFLDPMLNLGSLTAEEARQFLIRNVVLSAAMAKQEVDRYTFRAPGQATSYYYGYSRLMRLRGETEVKLGTKFDRLKFNDFILSQGLLPPDLLQNAVQSAFVANLQ